MKLVQNLHTVSLNEHNNKSMTIVPTLLHSLTGVTGDSCFAAQIIREGDSNFHWSSVSEVQLVRVFRTSHSLIVSGSTAVSPADGPVH